jgi:hypothetical protein
MKKETLEEEAEKYAKGKSSSSIFQEAHKKDFIAGANYQAERMYSEEEVRKAFKAGIAFLGPSFYGVNTPLQKHEDDFIEQFKKK